MSNLVAELADSLESEGQKTLAFFDAIQPEQWNTQVYSDGPGWKVHDLLAHFTEVEGSISRIIARIVAGGEGVADDFSIDEHNARYTAEMSVQDNAALLAEFARRRAATVQMVRAMSEADIEKRGRHPFLGPSAVKEMLRLMYIHLQGHQRDIRRALKTA
jgi:uncharacterized protein (TIGR03083 family)